MPKPPRFATPAAQQVAIGIVTAIIFALALGLAQIFSSTHQRDFGASLSEQRVDDLKLLLPDRWERAQTNASEQGFVGNVFTFVDRTIPGRYITISRPIILVPSSPDEVLRETLNIVTFRRSRLFFDKEKVRRFRVGTMAGTYYHAQSQAADQSMVSSDRFVVLTEDGRNHWVIAMHMPLHPSPRAEEAQDELMMAMARSAVDTSYHDASLPQANAAGLASIAEAGVALRLGGPRGDDQPLYFSLTDDAVPQLAIVRVRPQTDSDDLADTSPFSAHAGLSRLYAWVHGSGPDEAMLTQEKIAGRNATRLKLSDGKQRQLLREVIHVNMNDDHALLFDVLAEPEAMEAISTKLAALIETIAKKSASTLAPPPPAKALTRSLERGRDLAKAQQEQMVNQFTPQRRALLLRREGQVVGTQLHDQHHLPDQGLPLRSRKMRAVVRGADATVSWGNWFVSLDGKVMESTLVNEVREGPIHRSYAYQFTLKDQKLSASMVPARPVRDPIWVATVPTGYLPGFAEDSWDLSALSRLTADGPVVIWRTQGAQPPEPNWLEYVTVAEGPASEKIAMPDKAFAYVRIRPMMSMDGQRLWLDHDGTVIASDWIDTAQSPTGGIRLSLTPTDLQTVYRLYASHDFLRLWQQDVDQP